jgi:pimeloyl-ACP methyl ester carboxylesterase
VVVCNPLGDDDVRAHRVLRHLAERLQHAGFPVLRFDFDGTGDSSGEERDPDRVATWLDDIGRAIGELRARGAVDRVCLAGLRLGATLALVAAAERGDVDRLILWSPYVDGAAFVAGTTRMHRMHRMLEPQSFALEPPGWNAGGQEALGFVLTTPTIAALSRVDLMTLARRPARRALLVGAGPVGTQAQVAARLHALGTEVDHHGPADERFLISIPHKASVPEPVLEAMVTWLARPDGEAAPAPTRTTPPTTMTTTMTTTPPPPAPPDLGPAPNAVTEAPLLFAGAMPLFGILASPPPSARAGERPAIVLLNAGTVHRIGPHRMYVKLARRLAQAGFFVLRVDLSGIGDSPAPPECRENLCYPRDALADAQAAMTALGAHLGVRRFVLAGLCSGGDVAFQTARRDPRVATAVIMNPRTFGINDLALVEAYQRPRYYLETLIDGRKLLRLVRGQVDLRRAAGMLAANLAGVVRRRQQSAAAARAREDVPTALGRLVERGVDTLLIVAEHDPGVEYADRHFARGMDALRRVRGFCRVDLAGTDHTFTSLFAQQLVTDTVTRHLAARYRS